MPVRTAAMAPIHRSRARRVPPLHVTPVDRASAVALATALLLTSAPPAAHVHAHLLADVGEGAPASGFVERIKAALPKPLQEDPFGGDRVDKKRAPLASTKVGLLMMIVTTHALAAQRQLAQTSGCSVATPC
jgi:hypothetical protein